jgi:hypothetical protein
VRAGGWPCPRSPLLGGKPCGEGPGALIVQCESGWVLLAERGRLDERCSIML